MGFHEMLAVDDDRPGLRILVQDEWRFRFEPIKEPVHLTAVRKFDAFDPEGERTKDFRKKPEILFHFTLSPGWSGFTISYFYQYVQCRQDMETHGDILDIHGKYS